MADYTQPDVVHKRVRFFDGQFLQDQDFIDEQRYHLDRERRQSKLLRVTGIVEGLTVTNGSAYHVTVAKGVAVDDLGRQLVLAADLSLRLPDEFAWEQNIELRLVYQEIPTDVAPTGGISARRWDESPKIAARTPFGTVVVAPDGASSTWEGPTVLLALLSMAGNGSVTVDATVAPRAGLSVPGNVGIGTSGSESRLTVSAPQGHLQLRREKTETAGDTQIFLELFQDDASPPGIPEVHQGIQFRHHNRFSHRIEAQNSGFHFKDSHPGHGGIYSDLTVRNIYSTGNVGIGTSEPENAETWEKVVDILGRWNAKLSLRTAGIDTRVMVHDTGIYGAPAGMLVGTKSNHALSFVTTGATQLSIAPTGNVGIGTTGPPWKLSVSSSKDHLALYREAGEKLGGTFVFLELAQIDESPPTVPDVFPSIRFNHHHKFAHRIEGRPDGCHFKTGALDKDDYSGIRAGAAFFSSLLIGETIITEHEFSILKKLAHGDLEFDLWNSESGEHVMSDNPADNERRHVYTWRGPGGVRRAGRWKIRHPS